MVTRKDHPETSDAGQAAKADAEQADAAVANRVQEAIEPELAQGFRGVEVDPTPNENYTLDGVTSGAPTPETDPEHAEQVRQHLKTVEGKAAGVAER